MHSAIESTDVKGTADWFIQNLPNDQSLEWYPSNSFWFVVKKLVFREE